MANCITNPVQGVHVIVAVGNVDGMAGTAACLRHSGNSDIHLVFTQAFQVNTIDISKWPAKSKVGFVNLAVNNEGQTPNPQMTIDFVKKIYELGHTILFIADEHGKNAWKDVLEKCGHTMKELTIKPKDPSKYGSSCAILQKKLAETADDHTKKLLEDGHQGDLMNFNTPFGKIFNNGVKSNMGDPTRRPYMVKHMAHNVNPDDKIQGWMDEYAEMEANQPKILASREDLGNGISLFDASIGRHDPTAIFKEAYQMSPIAVLRGTDVFIANKKQVGVSIATNNKFLNVLKIIQDSGIVAGGMPAKANLALKDQDAAIEAIRAAVSKL